MAALKARVLLRIVHVLFGACIAVVVYAPTAWSEPFRLALGIVALPAVVLTGLAMWQQGRLRRWLGARRRQRSAAAPGAAR